MSKTNGKWAAVLAGGLMMVGQSALAGSINWPLTFTGDASNNWGWESKTDTSGQLGGAGQMTYTYAATNAKGYVSNTITDAASVFSDGTGVVTKQLRVDLSNYPVTTADWDTGPALAEVLSTGNKGKFTGGMISQIGVMGSSTANGVYRFSVFSAIHWYSNTATKSADINVGTNPSFPLVYDLTWKVTISGNDTVGWTVASNLSAEGPINSSGTIGTVVLSSTFTKTAYPDFNGWKSATGYAVGTNGVKGSAVAAGDSITFGVIPEPATLGLLAIGGLLMVHRSKR